MHHNKTSPDVDLDQRSAGRAFMDFDVLSIVRSYADRHMNFCMGDVTTSHFREILKTGEEMLVRQDGLIAEFSADDRYLTDAVRLRTEIHAFVRNVEEIIFMLEGRSRPN